MRPSSHSRAIIEGTRCTHAGKTETLSETIVAAFGELSDAVVEVVGSLVRA